MKIRIKPNGVGLKPRFSVQRKRWYGWEDLYNAELLSYCWKYIDDLKQFSNVELVKYQEVMKREEEIRQASIEYTICNRPMCIGGGAFSKVVDEMNRNPAFEAGAKWADENMINKACKWLDKVNTDNYMDSGVFQMSELILDFKKAMKGEQS